jgi:hypothetical protein
LAEAVVCVAVDRDDSTDALDAVPGNDAGPDNDTGPDAGPPDIRRPDEAASGPSLRERQLAEHVRYREVVETRFTIAAASDAWARAAPGLRAEWAAHKERYPDRERQAATTQPDGSWRGDGGRRLSPEQNAEAAKFAADLRDEAWQTIRPAIDRVAAADPDRTLAGLEHMLKGEDRLKEKLAKALEVPGITPREAMNEVPDAVRFTLVYPSERYSAGVLADVDRFKAEGFELIKVKNLWDGDQYKGVNSQWLISDTGTRVEVQFHTPESIEAKELTHGAYERIRTAKELAYNEQDSPEVRAMKDFQTRVNTLIPIPPGTDRIKEYQRDSKTEDNGDRQDHLLRDVRRPFEPRNAAERLPADRN